jgi:diaminohydroxyphosphoribosylaminopyrimidine deaminase/5-amino-6-(5-phosphoribosylamino)uracil reductase
MDTDRLMQDALVLAGQAVALSEPNPRVGCVIVAPDGRVIGRGHTQQAGGPHAEVMALRDAAAAGESVRGATVVVSLEPCAHHGRTPPCCDALVAAGVGRVVMALQDPNPLVAGQGAARLRAAGIEVVSGPGAEAARELNIGFFSRMERQRPWVRLKVAVSLDGRTALANGTSQWITGEAARADGHAWRRRAGALLTGVGTVLDDDPRLDVRLVDTPRQPLRVVVDSRLDTPPAARIVQPPGAVLLYAAHDDPRARPPCSSAAPRSRAAPARTARSTCRPCWPTWRAAASTSCTSRPATSSTAHSCARAWSTSTWSTWRPSCSAAAASWRPSGRSSSWPTRCSCVSSMWRAWGTTCA